MKKFLTLKLTILLVVLFAGSMSALAKEFSGINVPDTLSAGDTTLQLNGVGMRKKSIVSVYVGGLYLVTPSNDSAAILTADAPKAVSMHFVRDVTKTQLVDSFKEGFDANMKEQAAAENTNIETLFGILTDVKEGDVMTFAYVPGQGTTISKNGNPVDTIEGKAFSDVIFALWLGPKPPSESLKQGMLGT